MDVARLWRACGAWARGAVGVGEDLKGLRPGREHESIAGRTPSESLRHRVTPASGGTTQSVSISPAPLPLSISHTPMRIVFMKTRRNLNHRAPIRWDLGDCDTLP